MEDIISKPVIGFRAPAFSVIPQTAWALKIIADTGFKYDSSIVPARMKRYGWDGFEKRIVRLNLTDNSSIIEVPLSVINILGRKLPVCGGGYLRYLPVTFTKYAFSSISKNYPVIVYLHPYELDKNKYPDYFYAARKKCLSGNHFLL